MRETIIDFFFLSFLIKNITEYFWAIYMQRSKLIYILVWKPQPQHYLPLLNWHAITRQELGCIWLSSYTSISDGCRIGYMSNGYRIGSALKSSGIMTVMDIVKAGVSRSMLTGFSKFFELYTKLQLWGDEDFFLYVKVYKETIT